MSSLFLENAARLREGGMNKYTQELENTYWWFSVNLGICRANKKFTSKNERSEASAVEAMSYMLSSDALLFRNIPLTFTKKNTRLGMVFKSV